MSDINDDLLNYELEAGEDPALLNEDDLLLSDDEGGLRLDQQEEEFLLSESEDWVSKQLAAKEKEAAAASGNRKRPSASDDQKKPAAAPKRQPPPKKVAPAEDVAPAPVEPEVVKMAPPPPADIQEPLPTLKPIVAEQQLETPSSQESLFPASTDTETERDTTTEISSISGSSLVPESASGTSLTTESSTSIVDSGVSHSSAEQTHTEEETEAVSSQASLVPEDAERGSKPGDKGSSSQLCDTTSSEDVLDLYVTNQDREPEFYDTDESTEKRDWKNEGKHVDGNHKASSTSQQQQQHHPPHPQQQHRSLSNRPNNNYKHSGDSGASSGDQPPHFPPQLLGMPPNMGPGGPNFGPGGPFRGGMRPRFPPRPGFPGDMNNFRNNRMNFPMGGRPPFPPRGPPFDHMMRPGMIRPGDRPPFDPMRGGPRMGPGGPMFRPNGPGGPPPGGPPYGPMGGGPGGGPSMPPGGPVGPGPMNAMPPHQPPLLNFDNVPLAATAAAAPPPIPTAPVLPRKVLINPNFKGGVEAATSQLMRDALNSQQFLANINNRQVSDEELLRQQEEFINKNRAEVEKRRFERSPDGGRRRDRERARSRDRDRGAVGRRSRSRERSRSPAARRHRAGSRDRDSGSNRPPRRNFPSRRHGSRDRDDDSRYPKRRKSGDYGNNERKSDDEDPEAKAYRLGMEKQKAERERILRDKEMRRKQAAEENKKTNKPSTRKSEEPPAKFTPIVVTEKKIISLKKKNDEKSDRHSSNHESSTSSTKKSSLPASSEANKKSSENSDSKKSAPQAPAPVPNSPKRKVIDNRDELDLFLDEYEEELLREPTPSPPPPREKPAPPPSSNNNRGSGGGGGFGSSSRRIVLKSDSRQSDKDKPPEKKFKGVFDRLADKQTGVHHDGDKRKLQRRSRSPLEVVVSGLVDLYSDYEQSSSSDCRSSINVASAYDFYQPATTERPRSGRTKLCSAAVVVRRDAPNVDIDRNNNTDLDDNGAEKERSSYRRRGKIFEPRRH